MDQNDVLEALRTDGAGIALDDAQWDVIRFGIRRAFEFADFLHRMSPGAEVAQSTDLIAARISEGLHAYMGMRPLAVDILRGDGREQFDDIEYENESTASGGDIYPLLRRVAADIAAEAVPYRMQWSSYANAVELKDEYLQHFDTLRATGVTRAERTKALLNTARLQLIFLACTYC